MYKQKYLKYKNKYLSLIKTPLKGGDKNCNNENPINNIKLLLKSSKTQDVLNLVRKMGPNKNIGIIESNIKKLAFTEIFSNFIPSLELINKIRFFSGNKNILNVGAYKGFLSALLQTNGLNVTASDHSGFTHNNDELFTFVDKIDSVNAVNKYNNHEILLLIAPNFKEGVPVEILNSFKGNKIIYIGDYHSDCLNNPEFLDNMNSNWDKYDKLTLELENWENHNYKCLFFTKKGTSESKLLDEKYDALKNMQLRMAKPKVETEQQEVKKSADQPIEQKVQKPKAEQQEAQKPKSEQQQEVKKPKAEQQEEKPKVEQQKVNKETDQQQEEKPKTEKKQEEKPKTEQPNDGSAVFVEPNDKTLKGGNLPLIFKLN